MPRWRFPASSRARPPAAGSAARLSILSGQLGFFVVLLMLVFLLWHAGPFATSVDLVFLGRLLALMIATMLTSVLLIALGFSLLKGQGRGGLLRCAAMQLAVNVAFGLFMLRYWALTFTFPFSSLVPIIGAGLAIRTIQLLSAPEVLLWSWRDAGTQPTGRRRGGDPTLTRRGSAPSR